MGAHKPKHSVFTDNPDTGIRWENWFIESFGATRPSLSLNTPADFIWNNEAIDLKVCELYKRSRKRDKPVDPAKQTGVWVFNRNKIKEGVDSFICLGLRDGAIIKSLKIPAKDFPKSGITIGAGVSKYDRFSIDLSTL